MSLFRQHDNTLYNQYIEPKSHAQRSTASLCMVALLLGLSFLSIHCTPPTHPLQTSFRVRTDFSSGLNESRGWAGGVNESVTVYADQPFRIRFEVEAPGGQAMGLQYRRNEGDWTDVEVSDFPYPDSISPRVSIVSTTAYEPGEPTDDLLDGSGVPFRAGEGINLTAKTIAPFEGRVQTEWEWPLVIRRFADGAVTNNEGDVFAFRMVIGDGVPFSADLIPSLLLSIPPGHLGGTFVETPGRIGPWQATNGDLYFIMEPTETDNVLMMVKSDDGGATWAEVDGAHRPVADDLEGVASTHLNGVIHILHQTSDRVWYHAFHTADHPSTSDAWAITDEEAAAPEEPPTQVAALAARSDGSLVGVYGGPQKIHYKTRSASGAWSDEVVLDTNDEWVLSGPQVATGQHNEVHLAYTASDGTAWYRTLLPDGMPTARQLVSRGLGSSEYDVGSILPLVIIPESNTVSILYRLESGMLWERRRFNDGSFSEPVQVSDQVVIQNAVDSDQTGADAITFGERVHVLFIEAETGFIYSTQADKQGNWKPATLHIGSVDAQWIRGALRVRSDGSSSYAYVYDAGSNGGSGMNRFNEVVLPE